MALPSTGHGSPPAEPPSTPRADAVKEALRILAAGGAAQLGGVNLISLDPIKHCLEDRWPRKREQVWDHVQTYLKRQFRSDDMILRLDDQTVLVFQPGVASIVAQSKCVRAASDLMRFFLGEASPASVQVKIVDAIEADQVVCTPLDPQRLETMLRAATPELGKVERRQSVPVLTRLGRQLVLNLSLEPLWSLQPSPRIIGHYARAGLVDGATGRPIAPAERSQLQPGDLADVDMAVLKDALALRAASPKLAGGLIIPISYITLANSSTRYQVLQDVQKLDPTNRTSFGWEIVDLEPGVPSGRLSELIAIARRHCRGVICRIAATPANAEKVRATGATLSVEPPETAYTELTLFRLESAATSALRSVRALLLHEVPAQLLPIAGFVGATHCTVVEETRS